MQGTVEMEIDNTSVNDRHVGLSRLHESGYKPRKQTSK